MNELVSIVVPTYNVAQYVDDFFKKITNQSFSDFKIYVVYDNSEDDTLDKLKKWEGLFPDKIEILMSPQKNGLGAARDFALDSGKLNGKYILFLDPDDYPDDAFLEVLVKTAIETDADVVVCGFERFSDKTGEVICTEMIHNPEEIIYNIEEFDLLAYINPVVWDKLYKYECIKDTRFTNIKRTEDVFWLMRLIPHIKSIKFVNEVLYHYRVRADSLLNTLDEKSYEIISEGFKSVSYEENKSNKYLEILELIAFCRFGIGVTYRVAKSNMKMASRIERKTRELLDEYYPGWRKNKFLKLRQCSRHGMKGVAIWGCAQLYKIHMFKIYIWVYSLFQRIRRKEVRW